MISGGARRHRLRMWPRPARRAWPALCLWLALMAPHAANAQEISAAEYTSPTTAYPHGALGDDKEWSVVRITVSGRKGTESTLFQAHLDLTYDIKAPDRMVFEDTEPRLWDIDGDGAPEVVVVMSHQTRGAQLAVIAYQEGAFTYIATTPPIGRRFRWLAPVGAADLDGDGHVELAFVRTPHLSKTLHIWRYRNGEFKPVTSQAGLTNHQIGWNHIPGGLRDCAGRPELITANADWTRVMASYLENGSIKSREIAPYRGPKSLNAQLDCR